MNTQSIPKSRFEFKKTLSPLWYTDFNQQLKGVLIIFFNPDKQLQKRLCKISLTAYGIFLILFWLVQTQSAFLTSWDQVLNALITKQRQVWLTPAVTALTNFANPSNLTVLNAILLLSLLAFKQYALSILQLINALLIGSGGNHLLKLIVMRPRPTAVSHLVHAGGYSFPSGHAAASMVCFGFLILLTDYFVKQKTTRRRLKLLWAVLILLIGLSRIYVGVHNASDVLAGWCWGLGGFSLTWWCFSKLNWLPAKP